MQLSFIQSHEKLVANDHGTLATLHAARGVDLVPVVYTAADAHVGIPIDLVKPKASTRLQRERNLESDPRATLLIEHWDRDDWSALWWVRAELLWLGEQSADATDLTERLAEQLARRHVQYVERPFARVLVFRIASLSGWVAAT